MASWRDEVLLEGDFILLSKKKTVHTVTLTRRGVFFNASSNASTTYEEKSIQISDIIGCQTLDGNQNITVTVENGHNVDTTEDQDCGPTPDTPPPVPQSDASSPSSPSTPPFRGIPKLTDPDAVGFVIFAYPFRKKVFSGKKVRYRVALTFLLPPEQDKEQRKNIAFLWKNVITCLSRDLPVNKDSIQSCVAPPHGKLLILVNPHSGAGKAINIFKNDVEPMLSEAGIPYKTIITERQGHSSDLMKTLDMSEWYGIVVISGDGLIFETINGIMQREDWVSAIKKPIGCLPGGSGNALCCSINYAAGEPVETNMILHSLFVLIKHRIIPMDLVVVQLPDQHIFSCLSVTWGIVADIDYESEKYRNLGEARFTVGAFKRIMGLRSYKGKLSFLPVAEYRHNSSSSTKTKVLSKIRRFSLRSRSSSKSTLCSEEDDSPKFMSQRSLSLIQSGHAGSSGEGDRETGSNVDIPEQENGLKNGQSETMAGPKGHDDEGNHHSTCTPDGLETNNQVNKVSCDDGEDNINMSNSRARGDDQTLTNGCSDSKEDVNTGSKSLSELTVMSETQEVGVEEETYLGKKADFGPVPTPLLPDFSGEVPENWITLEGDFILMCAVYQTHLGSDVLVAPDAHLNDGFIHLMFVREGISKSALFNLFFALKDGTHIHSPFVEMVKVLAFRLEPITTKGNMMIDGERYPPTMLQAQILPGLSNAMAIK